MFSFQLPVVYRNYKHTISKKLPLLVHPANSKAWPPSTGARRSILEFFIDPRIVTFFYCKGANERSTTCRVHEIGAPIQ